MLITLSCKNEQANYSFFQQDQDISKLCICNRYEIFCNCKNKKFYLRNTPKQEPPCITMCRELDRYPNCECPNFEIHASTKKMTFDELFNKFEELIDSSRAMLREAREDF